MIHKYYIAMTDIFDLNKKAKKLSHLRQAPHAFTQNVGVSPKAKVISKKTLRLDESESEASIIEQKVRDKPLAQQKAKRTLNLAEDSSLLTQAEDLPPKVKKKKETPEEAKARKKKERADLNKKFPSTQYETAEIRKKLEGYKPVIRKKWLKIPVGYHIRLFKTNGKFLTGGFIRTIYQRDGSWHMILENRKFNRVKKQGYFSFPIHLDDIKIILVKPSKKKKAKTEAPMEEPTGADENIHMLATNVKGTIDVVQGQGQTIHEQEQIIQEQNAQLKHVTGKVGRLEQGMDLMTKYMKQKRL